MVPGMIVEVESIPLTPAGKVDFKALPDPYGAQVEKRTEPPTTEAETLLVDVWRRALGISDIGRQDNFFELGGHSLLSVQVVSEIKDATATGCALDPRTLFFQTLEQIASVIESASAPEPSLGPDEGA